MHNYASFTPIYGERWSELGDYNLPIALDAEAMVALEVQKTLAKELPQILERRNQHEEAIAKDIYKGRRKYW